MNILILTSVYKDPSLGTSDRSTNIVNSFVKEWVKQGHSVLVIHNSHSYPRIIHQIPKRIKKFLEARMGFPILDYEAVRKKTYIDNGASIFRVPIKKYIPHSKPNNYIIKKQTKIINDIISRLNFKPDVITGHWVSPQLELISELKKTYDCRTAIVLHGTGYLGSRNYNVNDYLQNIDSIGARSTSQAIEIKKILGLNKLPFVCYSGIPDEYLEKYSLNLEKFNDIDEWRITFVGRLVSYKNIDSIIRALSTINTIKWKFNIVGDGGEMKKLKELTEELDCSDKVKFWGRVSRDTVMDILKETHIFSMISTNEVFGLVYLEAMAASCITIASKKGGVDGIIRNEFNGYLCEQENNDELNKILMHIMNTEYNKLIDIAEKGYNTVINYSDNNVAVDYLNNIVNYFR